MVTSRAFAELRKRIRKSGRKFRNEDDNSESLFNPTGGFVYAYDIIEVERALDDYEETICAGLTDEMPQLEISAINLCQLLEQARLLSEQHNSSEARGFAKDTLDLLETWLQEDERPQKKIALSVVKTLDRAVS